MRTLQIDQLEQAMRWAWPLAVLLAPGHAAAVELLRSVACRRSVLGDGGAAHLERLVVLTARDLHDSHGGSAGPGAPEAVALLGGLAGQQREAWVLARVLGRDEVALSRAMDCSRTAAGRFLAQADEAVGDQIDGQAVQSLRAWAGSPTDGQIAAVLASVHDRWRRARLWHWIWVLAGLGVVLTVLTLV